MEGGPRGLDDNEGMFVRALRRLDDDEGARDGFERTLYLIRRRIAVELDALNLLKREEAKAEAGGWGRLQCHGVLASVATSEICMGGDREAVWYHDSLHFSKSYISVFHPKARHRFLHTSYSH